MYQSTERHNTQQWLSLSPPSQPPNTQCNIFIWWTTVDCHLQSVHWHGVRLADNKCFMTQSTTRWLLPSCSRRSPPFIQQDVCLMQLKCIQLLSRVPFLHKFVCPKITGLNRIRVSCSVCVHCMLIWDCAVFWNSRFQRRSVWPIYGSSQAWHVNLWTLSFVLVS
jgi:hypothetical protein